MNRVVHKVRCKLNTNIFEYKRITTHTLIHLLKGNSIQPSSSIKHDENIYFYIPWQEKNGEEGGKKIF